MKKYAYLLCITVTLFCLQFEVNAQIWKSLDSIKNKTFTFRGQKNFEGTTPITLGVNSPISLGGLYQGTPIGSHKWQRVGEYPLYIWDQLTHIDSVGKGDWRIYSSYGLDWDSSTTERSFTNYIISYNGDRKGNKAWMATGMEPEYELGYLNQDFTFYEWWYQYDWPAANPQYSVRPFQISILTPYDNDPDITQAQGVFALDQLWMGSPYPSFNYTLDWQFNRNGSSSLLIADTFYVFNSINNSPWLYQAGHGWAVGNPAEIARVDTNNYVSIAPNVYTDGIKLNKPTIIPESTIPRPTTDAVTLYNQDGSLKAITGSGEIKNLTATIIPIDTGGVGVGEWYADNLSGEMSIRLPEYLLTNGEFTEWTGVGKAQTPDSWSIGVQDSLHWYLEESPTGQLHYVSDANPGFNGSVQQTVSIDSGSICRYSIYVPSTIDSFLVVILGNNLWIDEAGLYSDQIIAQTAGYDVVRFSYYGNSYTVIPADFTIDYIRIYDVEGNIRNPYNRFSFPISFENPTINDLRFVGRKDNAAVFDSIAVFDVIDSIAFQVYYDDGSNHNLFTTVDTLIADTTLAFDVQNVPAGSKVYIDFIYLGNSEAYLRSQIYWRE